MFTAAAEGRAQARTETLTGHFKFVTQFKQKQEGRTTESRTMLGFV